MKPESGNTEGHAAVLKMHRGAYMGRTGVCGASNRIQHSHHREPRPAQPAPNTNIHSAMLQCRRKRGSIASTSITYSGITTDNEANDTTTERSEVTPAVVYNIETGKARPLTFKNKPSTSKVTVDVDIECDKDDEEEHKEESAGKDAARDIQQDEYIRMCKLEGITPCRRFKRQITDVVADMSNCLLGTKDIKSICVSLSSNVTIKELDLSGNDLSNKGARYVAEALRENSTVEDLTLSQCNMDLEGLRAIATVLLDMKPMKRLDMSNNQFERKQAEIFADIIKKNDYIEELVLSGNKFDDVGGTTIGKALVSNVGIKKLDLSWNHLRRDGARTVCMALKSNQTLEEVDLSWNGLAEEGAKALGVALPHNHTLKELDISCNRITAFCLPEFLKGLEKNDTLKVLRVSQNPLTTDGAIAFMKTLTKSSVSQLEDLYMTDIPINPDFLDELDELLKKRAVKVYHRDPNMKKITPIVRHRSLKDYDPAMILFEYMKQENLRLIDLFRTFDTDSSQSVSKEELKEGFVTINMPLTEDALESLFNRLDLNDNDEIEYDEYRVAYRKSMNRMRKDLNSENEHEIHGITQLKSLVKKALDDRRHEKLIQLKGKRRQRQASLTAVFQYPSDQALVQTLQAHPE